MSLYYSSEIRRLFSQISLKKQEIEQLRSKELLTSEDENAIIDNAIEIARLEVKISEQQGKEANDSFSHGLPPGLIGFQVDNDDKLHENCLRLIKLRNNFVAHSEPTEWGDFCEVFNCFQNIMKYHIPNLMEVKNLMRAKGHCH